MYSWEKIIGEANIRRPDVIFAKHDTTPLLLEAKIMQEADQTPREGRQSNEMKIFLPTSLPLLFKHDSLEFHEPLEKSFSQFPASN